jgi:hypothetical protein
MAQHSQAQNAEKALTNFVKQHPQEKVYIHYDKDYYATGETMFFKAYFYSNGYPSMVSSNFYLQLLNNKGDIIDQKHYGIGGGTLAGSIDLPDSLPTGNYIVRAGTPNMLQEDPSFIYKKSIFVYNPASGQSATGNTSSDLLVQFFPESGNMVDGILSTIAFKATDAKGKPIEVTGMLKSPDGVDIPFKSFHDGIGKFQFRPKAGLAYAAEVTANGKTTRVDLPAVQTSGINLHVQDEKGGKLFQLGRSNNEKEKYNVLNLVVTLNNAVVYDNTISFDDYPSVKGHLVTDSLTSGILHFTVFNEQMQPLAERLAFVNNEEYKSKSNLDIRTKGLQKRQQNSYQLSFSDTVPTSLSVSVADAAITEVGDKDNIYSRLLLTSDLKGYVYNPSWYFNANDENIKQGLDNLMLTHGWSRYKWTELLANTPQAKPKAEKYLLALSGQVVDPKDQAPVSGGRLIMDLEAADSNFQHFELEVDKLGKFAMDSLLYSGNGKFFYQYTNSNGKAKDVLVQLDENKLEKRYTAVQRSWVDAAKVIPSAETSLTVLPYKLPKQETEVKTLEKVVLTSKEKRPTDEVNDKYATGFFRTMGKIVIDNINEPAGNASMSVVTYLSQSMRTVELKNGKFINKKNMTLLTQQNWEVGVMLDENSISVSNLQPIRMDEVAMIKFYEGGFPGNSAPGGAIVVYTKKDNEGKKKQVGTEKYFELNGFSIVKEYYHPNYAIVNPANAAPDSRTTLYWNPAVFTSGQKPTFDIKFYNNDISKKLRVTVEGFDARGRLIHVEKVVSE